MNHKTICSPAPNTTLSARQNATFCLFTRHPAVVKKPRASYSYSTVATMTLMAVTLLSGCSNKVLMAKDGGAFEAHDSYVGLDAFSYKSKYCEGFADEPALLRNHLIHSLSTEEYSRYQRLKRAASPTARASATEIEAAGRLRLQNHSSDVEFDRPYVVFSDWVSLKPIQGRPGLYTFNTAINSSVIHQVRKLRGAPVDLRLVQDHSISEFESAKTVTAGGPLGLQEKTYSVEQKIPASYLTFDLTRINERNAGGIWYDFAQNQLVIRVPRDFERDVIQPDLDEGWLTTVKVNIAAVIDSCRPTPEIMKSHFSAIDDIRVYVLAGHIKRIEVFSEKKDTWAGAVNAVLKGVRFEGNVIAQWDR